MFEPAGLAAPKQKFLVDWDLALILLSYVNCRFEIVNATFFIF